MNASSFVQACELHLVLDGSLSELVRAFAREASLAEGLPLSIAILNPADSAQVLRVLCALGSSRELVRVAMLSRHEEVRLRILLHGYSRFSSVVSSLAGRIRRDAGISCHQHGIDGWEICIHRSVTLPPLPSLVGMDGWVSAPPVPQGTQATALPVPKKSE